MMLAKSLQSAAGNAAGEANYIEDVFSTWLYTGNGSTQTITNGIDLAGEGGLVWLKRRDNTSSHVLVDSQRGISKFLRTNSTDAESTSTTSITAFNSDGFSLGTGINVNGGTYASWTFRKQPKFFDVVTYTGNGAEPRTISHNLGSVPGCIIVKVTSGITDNWVVYHRSLAANQFLKLNTTDAVGGSASVFTSAPNETSFFVGNDSAVNQSSCTYVAYLFAHDAGGFGLSGTDNVVSCGSYTGTGATGNNVTLGYEPQWLMIKAAERAQDWFMFDVMRGMTTTGGTEEYLLANTSEAAGSGAFGINPTATGFGVNTAGTSFNAIGEKYIYIAIRRGPMKVPESGTSVFSPNAFTSSGTSGASFGVGFPSDLFIFKNRGQSTDPFNFRFIDRLRGNNPYLISSSTAAEVSWVNTNSLFTSRQNDIVVNTNSTVINGSGESYIYWNFRRAPGFFDEVCYTGTGSLPGVAHNLGVTPELKLIKCRSATTGWFAGGSIISENAYLQPNTGAAAVTASNYWNGGDDSPTIFSVRNSSLAMDSSGQTYVAYLFASCPGVQSIQSYVGDGTTGRTINCGFTGGARFVCIKATSATGSWWTFDSARGITINADPVLQLNSTDAEITSADAIDPAASGFIVNQEATCSLNASGVSYLVWAIA